MTRRILLALASVFLLAGVESAAANLRFAVVDMEKIFQEFYKTKIADASLNRQTESFKEYSDRLAESLAKLQDEFRDLRDQSLSVALSEVERERRRLLAQEKFRQVEAKERELEQFNRESQERLRRMYETSRGEVVDEIKKMITRKAVLEGYELVLDISGKTMNNIASVVYFNPTADITNDVITELNRGQPTGGGR